VGDLSESTLYTYDNGGLVAVIDGAERDIKYENMYNLMLYISITGEGKTKSKVPTDEPVVLQYADGATMELWDVAPADGERSHKLFLRFTNADGKAYSYISDQMTLDTINVRYLADYKN
jgi:hypothetical protein